MQAHAARLAELGYADDAALATAIRNGELDHRSADLRQSIKADVAAKLRVSNPAYLQENA